MSAIIEVKYFNSFWLKKVEKDIGAGPTESTPTWPGIDWDPFGYPAFPIQGAPNNSTDNEADGNWYLEEARIKGGFNNTMVAQGVRAYANEENPIQDVRSSSIIYSGIYNSRTDINRTNVFSINEQITKSVDPANGSIQKLFAEDTNLIIFQENKVTYSLIDKDAIYSAEGGGTVTSANVVIGQNIPFLGKYGIGKHPESFAQFGFRKYFVDPNRGTVMRLSRDGLTEVSSYGMKDFFRDELTSLTNNYSTNHIDWVYDGVPSATDAITTFVIEDLDACNIFIGSQVFNVDGTALVDTGSIVTNIVELVTNPVTYQVTVDKPFIAKATGVFSFDYKSKIIGSWDNFNKYYTLSIQETPSFVSETKDYFTLSFDETINGWVSFFNFKPSTAFSLKSQYYTTINNKLYQHNWESLPNNYGVFYGVNYASSINFIVNVQPSLKKVFTTINYEGDNGWQVDNITSSFTGVDLLPNQSSADFTNTIYSYEEGLYIDAQGYPIRCGFDRKENLYVAALRDASLMENGQVLGSSTTTGLKGYFLDVTLRTDGLIDLSGVYNATTDPQGSKEIWSVGTTFTQSS